VAQHKKTRRPKRKTHESRLVELRGYLNYASWRSRGSDITIDCVIVTQQNQPAILRAKRQIENLVRVKFGAKLAAMLHYGISEVTPSSANHFLYSHGEGEEWRQF
jgi:hypothetical protein